MANNTVALGYLDFLADLLILGTSEPCAQSGQGGHLIR
jgi:hypothetical protein